MNLIIECKDLSKSIAQSILFLAYIQNESKKNG
jgi:hypothetical protein